MPTLRGIIVDQLFGYGAAQPDNDLEGYLLLLEDGSYISDEGGFGVFALEDETFFVTMESGDLIEHEEDFDTVIIEAQ